MRKSRLTEAEIIGMLKENEAGIPTADACRSHDLSSATFYKQKAKYGGMEISARPGRRRSKTKTSSSIACWP